MDFQIGGIGDIGNLSLSGLAKQNQSTDNDKIPGARLRQRTLNDRPLCERAGLVLHREVRCGLSPLSEIVE